MISNATTAPVVINDGAAPDVNKRTWIILALLTVYIIWGTTYLAIRFALESFPPYLMIGIRFTLAGGGMLLFLRLRGTPMPTLRQVRGAVIIGLLLLVGGMGSVALAEKSISSGLAATLVATSPVWAMLFSMLWGGRPARREWIGVALGITGVALLSLEKNLQANPLAVGIMLFATISWAFGSVLSGYLEMPKGAMGNAVEMLGGGLILIVLGLLFGERITTVPTGSSVLALLYLTTFGSLATLTAYMFLLKTVSPALATSYAMVNPAIALFLGVLLGGEQITGSVLIALPIILVGIGFVVLRKQQITTH